MCVVLFELSRFGDELKDRYGPLSPEAATLLEYQSLLLNATAKGVIRITVMNDKLLIETPRGLLRDRNRDLLTVKSHDAHGQMQEIRKALRRIPS